MSSIVIEQPSAKFASLTNENEVVVKLHMIKEEKYSNFYAVTNSKRILVINIGKVPARTLTKSLGEFSLDEEIFRVVFFNVSKYVLISARSRKVLVSSYDTDLIPNRVIDVGFDMIGDIFMMPSKLFGITHPQKKIISFFELDEKECSSKLFKKCEPLDLRIPLECNPGTRYEQGRCHCTLG